MIRDDIFWHTVKEHYIEKKKKLMSCTDIESHWYERNLNECLAKHNLDNSYLEKLKSLTTIEELNNEYKKLKFHTIKNEFRQNYLKIYIELLIAQLTPLLPPYTEEQIKDLTKNLNRKGLKLPNDVYDYYTKVSRELLVFNRLPFFIDKKFNNNENQKYAKGDFEQEPMYYGFWISSNQLNTEGNGCCRSQCKFVYLKPGKLCGSIWMNTDDGYDQSFPSYKMYAKSFSGLIEKKMRKENNGNYDRRSNLYGSEFNNCNKSVYYNKDIFTNPDFDNFDDDLDDIIFDKSKVVYSDSDGEDSDDNENSDGEDSENDN